MKKYFIRILTGVIGLAAFGAGTKAQSHDQLIVNIPYEFVVLGKTLPSGTYRVNRVSDSNVNHLILSSFENRTGAMVISTEWEDARIDQPGVTFQEIGGQHFLRKIETAAHVFTISLPKSAALEAMKPSQGFTGSGTSSAK